MRVQPWSHLEVETLRQARRDGVKFSELPSFLPDRSRNACIGKMHRLEFEDEIRRLKRMFGVGSKG